MQSAITCVNHSYKPSWLTSHSYEFPSYSLFDRKLSDKVALILYYAHIMDQKKLLKDFFRLCKDNFGNKCESSVIESAVKTWIRHSIAKLHRRREQIISDAVTTLEIQMLRMISKVIFSIFCDLLRESSNKASSLNIDTGVKKHISSINAYSKSFSTLFSGSEMLSSSSSHFNGFRSGNSASNRLFLSLHFKDTSSISKVHPMQWLRRFWLNCCYQPDPTNCINLVNPICVDHVDANVRIYLDQTSQNDDCDNNVERAISPHNSNDDLLSVASTENSDSSGSWSCADFHNDTTEDIYFNSVMSHGVSLDKCNSTLAWLRSTSVYTRNEEFSFDDENIVFEDVITEENCLERARCKGSLSFVELDESEDVEIVFSDSAADVSFTEDSFEEASQGYVNLCFEDEFNSFCVPKLRTVNENWDEIMLDVADKPRQASKVSFAPEPTLVTVHCFERIEDNSYATAICDRIRFQHRVRELNKFLGPFLTCEHRAKVQLQNDFYQV